MQLPFPLSAWVSAQAILNLARVRMDLLGKRGLDTLRHDHEILHTHRPPVLLASVRPDSLSAPIAYAHAVQVDKRTTRDQDRK